MRGGGFIVIPYLDSKSQLNIVTCPWPSCRQGLRTLAQSNPRYRAAATWSPADSASASSPPSPSAAASHSARRRAAAPCPPAARTCSSTPTRSADTPVRSTASVECDNNIYPRQDTFSCEGQGYGYYADVDSGCQVRSLEATGGRQCWWLVSRCSTSASPSRTTKARSSRLPSGASSAGTGPCSTRRASPATGPRTPSPARSPPACTAPRSSARSPTRTTRTPARYCRYYRWF